MMISTEPESNVSLENNKVTLETEDIAGNGGTSNAALLVEIQKLRSELLVVTEENKKNRKIDLKDIESKIEDEIENMKKEMSEKLQSIEALTSKVSKSNENTENSNNTANSVRKSEKRFNLNHVFKNVKDFKEGLSNVSEWEEHYNVKWSISVMRNFDHLGFYVRCEPIAPTSKWSIRTRLQFKVVGPNQKDVIRTWECYYEKSQGCGFHKFTDWEKMEKWHLVDGNLTVEVHGEIVETTGFAKEKIRKFDESRKDFSDVILVVGDTKFYVLKMYLASQSSVFETLLLGNFSESKQSEVKLHGIDPDNFIY